MWVSSLGIGASYQPDFAKGYATGGSVISAEVGWMKEWERWALKLSVPLETDFGSRLAIGPQINFELIGSFRFFFSAMLDIPFGSAYSIFFLRGGLELGYRNTGKRATLNNSPLQAGLYVFIASDYRIPLPEQPSGQEFRLMSGLRIEIGLFQ
jgi:hypothetical protein